MARCVLCPRSARFLAKRWLPMAAFVLLGGCAGMFTKATVVESSRGPRYAQLLGPDVFDRLVVDEDVEPLRTAELAPGERLLLVERGGERLAFRERDLAWHHVAQGTLGGEPFVLAYCVACHGGVGVVPVLPDGVHHFSAGGLSDGIVMLLDDETRTYWDVFTGEAEAGPLRGARLEVFAIEQTTVDAALKSDPALRLARGHLGIGGAIFAALTTSLVHLDGGFLPPQFARTLPEPDPRRPRLEHGLGVVVDGQARFYPEAELADPRTDRLAGNELQVELGECDRVPVARLRDGARPFQIYTRWYAFSASFPDCTILAPDPRPATEVVAVTR